MAIKAVRIFLIIFMNSKNSNFGSKTPFKYSKSSNEENIDENAINCPKHEKPLRGVMSVRHDERVIRAINSEYKSIEEVEYLSKQTRKGMKAKNTTGLKLARL